jgi:hypothetical protein
VFEFITNTVDEGAIHFATVIAFVKTLPAGTDGIGTDY